MGGCSTSFTAAHSSKNSRYFLSIVVVVFGLNLEFSINFFGIFLISNGIGKGERNSVVESEHSQ